MIINQTITHTIYTKSMLLMSGLTAYEGFNKLNGKAKNTIQKTIAVSAIIISLLTIFFIIASTSNLLNINIAMFDSIVGKSFLIQLFIGLYFHEGFNS